MRKAIFLTALGIVTAPAAAREPIGIFFRWGAFEETQPRRCTAMAASLAAPGRSGPAYSAISLWPDRRVGPQFYVRLSQKRRPGSAAILRIDDRIFQLSGSGRDLWAANAEADRAIVAAIRTGAEMSVETRSPQGARLRDRYRLRGAASAIDSAIFACAGR